MIDVRNWFLLSGISLPFFFKLCIRVDIGNECLGIADAYILSNYYRVMALDVQNCVLLNILTNGQILIFCFVTKYPVMVYVACLQRFYYVFVFKMNA